MCEPVTASVLGATALKGVVYGAGVVLGTMAVSEAVKAVKESNPKAAPKAARA